MATRIGIIGAGAIGSIVGGMLTKAGHDVTLIEQWPEHVEAMKKVGLRLSGTCGEHVVPVKALHIHEVQSLREPFDTVFISVKSYDTEWAAAMAVANLRQPDGVVVDFQNGINDERVAAVAGRRVGAASMTNIGMQLYTVRNVFPFLESELGKRGVLRHGLTWHFNRPPVVDLEYEMDCRRVHIERVVEF